MLVTTAFERIKVTIHHRCFVPFTDKVWHGGLSVVFPKRSDGKLCAVGEPPNLLANHPGIDVIEACPTQCIPGVVKKDFYNSMGPCV